VAAFTVCTLLPAAPGAGLGSGIFFTIAVEGSFFWLLGKLGGENGFADLADPTIFSAKAEPARRSEQTAKKKILHLNPFQKMDFSDEW